VTGDDKKYVHAYDYMGRRVRTRVYTWNTQQEQWDATPDEDQRLMYHGRQRILTLSGSGADDELFKFVWGPDPGSVGPRGRRPHAAPRSTTSC
jgi:hypothetical protein